MNSRVFARSRDTNPTATVAGASGIAWMPNCRGTSFGSKKVSFPRSSGTLMPWAVAIAGRPVNFASRPALAAGSATENTTSARPTRAFDPGVPMG